MPHCRAKMHLKETCQEAAEPVNKTVVVRVPGAPRPPAARELSAELRCAQPCDREVTPRPGHQSSCI